MNPVETGPLALPRLARTSQAAAGKKEGHCVQKMDVGAGYVEECPYFETE
jgi:hypothetical protein